MCTFIENCILNTMVTRVRMIIGKSSIASVSKNQNLIQTLHEMGRFFTANRSTKYDFCSRNAFYDPSYNLNIISYKSFYS